MIVAARAMDDPTFITVSGKSKYKSLKDVIDASKKAPLNWGANRRTEAYWTCSICKRGWY